MSRISYLPPLTGAMSPIYGGEGPRMYAARDREWRRRGLDSAGRPLIMAPNVLPAGPPRGPPTPGGSLEEAQKNLLAKQQARERLAIPYEPGVTPEGRMSFGSGGPPARGGTVGDAGDLAGGPWTEMTPVPVTDEEQANVEANPAYQRLDQQAMLPGGLSGKAEARHQLLRAARGGDLGLTGRAEAELAGLPQQTINYAERVAKSHVATRKAGEDRVMARNLRMRGPGPMMMRMMQGPEGEGGEAGFSPRQLGAMGMMNPRLAQTIGQAQFKNAEIEALREDAAARRGRWQGEQRQALDLAWGEAYASGRTQMKTANPTWSPEKLDAEARKQASVAVPGATRASGALPNAGPGPGGGPTPGESLSVENAPGKAGGQSIQDFVLLFSKGTPPSQIREAALRKGYTPEEWRDFERSISVNYGWIFGGSGMRKGIKARERALGRPVTTSERVGTGILQGLPLVGPAAVDIMGYGG